MMYKIFNNIDSKQIDKLKNLKGKILNKIYVDEFGKTILAMVFNTYECNLILKNTPSILEDKDDYPRFTVEEGITIPADYKEIIVNKLINKVSIIRDEVSWKNGENTWKVVSDIAIKLDLGDEKWLIIACDTLGGLIDFIQFKGECGNTDSYFKDYWGIKTDLLRSLKRKEI